MRNLSVVSHLVSVRASVGRSEQVGACLSGLIEASAQWSGCLHCAVQRSLSDDSVWLLTGTWTDSSAMNDWFCAPELMVFSELLAQRLVSSLDFQTFNVIAASKMTVAEQSPSRQAVHRTA